jgi:hypothetical protein
MHAYMNSTLCYHQGAGYCIIMRCHAQALYLRRKWAGVGRERYASTPAPRNRQGASAPPENELHVETNVIWMQGAYGAETCRAGVLLLPSNWTVLSHTWNETNLPDKEYLELLSRERCRFVGSIQILIFRFWNKTKIGNVEVGVRKNYSAYNFDYFSKRPYALQL